MIPRRHLVYSLLGAVTLLLAAAWWHHQRVVRAYASATLLEDLATVDMAERTLRLIDEGRLDTARAILNLHLKSSIDSAEDMTLHGGSLMGIAWPNLREGLRRSADRASREGNAALAARIQ